MMQGLDQNHKSPWKTDRGAEACVVTWSPPRWVEFPACQTRALLPKEEGMEASCLPFLETIPMDLVGFCSANSFDLTSSTRSDPVSIKPIYAEAARHS